MNDIYLNGYTIPELVNYYSNMSTDPNLLRLIKFYEESSAVAVIDDLVNEGMDAETFEFDGYLSPAMYIRHLQSELDFTVTELHETQSELAALKTRSIVKFLADVDQQLESAKLETERARLDRRRTEKELDEVKNKLKMWSKLCAQPEELK